MLNWINIVDQSQRVSSLLIDDKKPNKLAVIGGLNHGALFEPQTTRDADKLIKFLQSWKKKSQQIKKKNLTA